MIEQIYLPIALLIVICSLAGIVSIVRARRKREKTYYWASGFTFLVAIWGVVVLFEQFLLSFFMIIVLTLLGVALLPRMMELNKQEIVKQKQETDVSTPLQMRDFLTWKAWIKIKARYGFLKMITLYFIVTMGIVAAAMLAFVASGLITQLSAVFSAFLASTLIVMINYRQLHKALKEA